jgi:hypothetical protein
MIFNSTGFFTEFQKIRPIFVTLVPSHTDLLDAVTDQVSFTCITGRSMLVLSLVPRADSTYGLVTKITAPLKAKTNSEPTNANASRCETMYRLPVPWGEM